jgi:hypothetical protein
MNGWSAIAMALVALVAGAIRIWPGRVSSEEAEPGPRGTLRTAERKAPPGQAPFEQNPAVAPIAQGSPRAGPHGQPSRSDPGRIPTPFGAAEAPLSFPRGEGSDKESGRDPILSDSDRDLARRAASARWAERRAQLTQEQTQFLGDLQKKEEDLSAAREAESKALSEAGARRVLDLEERTKRAWASTGLGQGLGSASAPLFPPPALGPPLVGVKAGMSLDDP